MSSAVIGALIRKEMKFAAPIMVMTVVAGFVAIALTAMGGAGLAVGGILFITACLASGIFLVMYAVTEERRHFARLFALSLPISGFQLDVSKLAGILLSWLIPWSVLTAAVVAGVLLGRSPDGLVVYVLLVQCCILSTLCVFLAIVMLSRSEAVSGAAILLTNMAFSLFMVTVNQPEYRGPLSGETLNWTPFATGWIAAYLLIAVAAIGTAVFFLSRKRDYV